MLFWYSTSNVRKKRQSFNYRALQSKVDVGVAPFGDYKDFIKVVWGVLPANLIKVD